MKNLTGLQKFLIVIGVIAVIFVLLNWNKIFGSKADVSSIKRNTSSLSARENLAINKAKTELSNIGVTSRVSTASKTSEINAIVANLNRSFRNIGSNLVAKPNPGNSDCDSLCKDAKCRGSFSSWLFGFCICLRCPERD